MKYKDYVILNEDEGGDVAVNVDANDQIKFK